MITHEDIINTLQEICGSRTYDTSKSLLDPRGGISTINFTYLLLMLSDRYNIQIASFIDDLKFGSIDELVRIIENGNLQRGA